MADDRLACACDRDSDTLIVHLRGRGRAAVSAEAGDRAYVRWDRAADEIVGLHLENILRGIVPRHPELLDHGVVFGVASDTEAGGEERATAGARKRAARAALAPLFDRRMIPAKVPPERDATA